MGTMKALVTGATGFIGNHLTRRLLTRGDSVHVILRKTSDSSRLAAGTIPHLHDGTAAQLCAILEAIRPDVVFHLASRVQDHHMPGDIDGLIRDNVIFGSMLADAMVKADAKLLVNTGTSWQHYKDAAYSPVCLYAATKEAFEAILRYYAEVKELSVVTLKLFDTYGPHDRRGKILSRLTEMIRDGSRLSMSPGEQLVDFLHVDDVVDAFLLAAERLHDGAVTGMEDYAVSSGSPRTLRDVAALVAQCAGVPLNIEWGGRPYRFREVMEPWSTGKPVPGWSPRIGLEEELRTILADNV